MKKLLSSTVLVAALAAFSGQASAQECGDVTIANMNWQSAELIANIDKLILGAGYGCDAELVAGDTMPTLTSMSEKGQPDVSPETWADFMREVLDRAVDEGKLVYAGTTLPDGGREGWWIPKYLADKHPEIKTINDALARPDLFPAPEDPSKGAVYNGPAGWGGTVTTSNFFRAFDAEEKGFVLVDTGSAAGLDGSMSKAYERGEGWLGFYWEPTALLGKYEMVKLDHGVPFDQEAWDSCNTVVDCPDPQPNAWGLGRVETVLAADFANRAGPAVDYLKKRSWPNATVNKLLAWMTDNQATGEEGAIYFLQNYEDMWTQWVPPEAVEKIKEEVR